MGRVGALAGQTAAAMAVAIGLSASLSACASSSPTATVEVSPAIALSAWQPGLGADDALLEGTLAVENGCLYVIRTDGARDLPVFPSALASWNPTTQTLHYNGETYEIGDTIAAGGGWFGEQPDDTIPMACEPDEYGDAMHIQDTTLRPMSER